MAARQSAVACRVFDCLSAPREHTDPDHSSRSSLLPRAGPGKFGHGAGPGPEYVTHQFRSNVLRSPEPGAVDSSFTSKPTDAPNVRDTCPGGLPAMIFRRMTLSAAVAWIRIPFVLPPMLLSSTTLPLLPFNSPTPKSLLLFVTDPFPLN